jgi:hypothetical protein
MFLVASCTDQLRVGDEPKSMGNTGEDGGSRAAACDDPTLEAKLETCQATRDESAASSTSRSTDPCTARRPRHFIAGCRLPVSCCCFLGFDAPFPPVLASSLPMDGDELQTEALQPGRTIGRNFRIERLLGEGAMGQVYLAEQLSLGKKVAIKVLHRHLARDPALARRFQREAKSASQLNHANSIQIIDFGQDAEGALFIAMELLEGATSASSSRRTSRCRSRASCASWGRSSPRSTRPTSTASSTATSSPRT